MLKAIGNLFHPLYHALAYLLVFWYGLVPNYAVAIALFTITVMVVLAPLTVKSTRSMLAMQRLQPEVNALKAKHKNDKMAMQTEMSALFKANGVNPAGGCLPMLIQLPVFWVLYRIIEGLTKTVKVHGVSHVVPQYISHTSLLYKHLIAAHGSMVSFGMNLAKAATGSHGSLLAALPFYGLLVVCIGLQFVQMRQLSSRTPKQTGAAAQTQAVMKFMPLIFGFIYLAIPAGVNVYFLVSSLFRIGQQELMYRYDPQVKGHADAVKQANKAGERGVVTRGAADPSSDSPKPAGILAALRAARDDLVSNATANGASARGTTKRAAPPRPATWTRSTAPAAASPRDNGHARASKTTASNGARPPKTEAPPKATQAQTRKPAGGAKATPGPARAKSARPAATGARSGNAATGPGSQTEGSQTRRDAEKLSKGSSNGTASRASGAASKGAASKGAANGKSALPDGSWARRPRETASVAAGSGGKGPRVAPGSPTSAAKAAKPRSGAQPSPNRSRAKRPRRAR
ncbi:MAG: membrane protein insertase YidC [Acidimicrobiales bacterium]